MRLYNTDTSPVVVGGFRGSNLAVLPGEAGDFDADTAAYLLGTGRWSEKDPRAGIEQERAFKERRRAEVSQTPAAPDNQGAK